MTLGQLYILHMLDQDGPRTHDQIVETMRGECADVEPGEAAAAPLVIVLTLASGCISPQSQRPDGVVLLHLTAKGKLTLQKESMFGAMP